MKEQADRIEDAIRKPGVFSMDPSKRRNISAQIAAYGFNAGQVTMAWHEAARSSGSPEQARGLFASVLMDMPRFREVVRDLEDVERRRHQMQGESSSIANVTETNPFGWKNPELHRCNDHSRPGEWNAFRHEYNMTLAETRAFGTTDVRRHGCSRYEVLGPGRGLDYVRKARKELAGDIQHATHYWDALPVELAQGKGFKEPPDAPERPVYGEMTP